MENGDTSPVNDLVTRQYENLPYPPFSPLRISNEEKRYKLDIDTPVSFYPGHTLEKYNQYLHRGEENYR